MEIKRADFDAAAAGTITIEQAEELWSALERRTAGATAPAPSLVRPRFDFVHVAYYFGALIVIGAMGMFMTLGWESFGGGGLFAIASAYAVCFLLAGRTLWQRDDLKIPGGLLVTMAVGMTPLATYAFERTFGWWPLHDPGAYRGFHEWINGGWFVMEVATVLVGVIALRFFRFPFLVMPIAFVLWYMSMDLAPLLFGVYPSWTTREWVSVGVGLVVLAVAYVVDRRTREDFAFWLYLFGLLAFWGGLTSMDSGSEFRKFLYLLINLGLMAVSVLLGRRTFIVFGAMGVMGYLGHLAYSVFKDSLLFPFALSGIGVAIIAFGLHYHRHREGYERTLFNIVPESIRRMLPPARVRA